MTILLIRHLDISLSIKYMESKFICRGQVVYSIVYFLLTWFLVPQMAILQLGNQMLTHHKNMSREIQLMQILFHLKISQLVRILMLSCCSKFQIGAIKILFVSVHLGKRDMIQQLENQDGSILKCSLDLIQTQDFLGACQEKKTIEVKLAKVQHNMTVLYVILK